MRIALALLRIGFLDAVQYRIEAFIWFLFDLLPPIVMVYLWLAVYEERADVAGYSLDQMLGYYVGVLILTTLLTSHVEWGIAHDVRQGLLSALLLRPVSPWTHWFMDNLAWKGARGLFLTPSTLILIVALGGYLSLPRLSPLGVVLLIVSLVLAYLLCFTLKAILGMAAFWMTDVMGLIGVWEVLMLVLGGTVLPLELLPLPLQWIATVLPFKYIFAFPLTLGLGRLEPAEIWSGLVIQIAWLGIALLGARLAWRRAIRRYEAVGN